jgi:SAM-dependent methyltransferase
MVIRDRLFSLKRCSLVGLMAAKFGEMLRDLLFELFPWRWMQSTRAFMRIVVDAGLDSGQRAAAVLDREFECRDPWNYDSPAGARRFERELDLIRSVTRGTLVDTALEIGCAEGAFTERLAPYCKTLLAVDINMVALERARQRCNGLANVHFQPWDLRYDDPPGVFDLVVATSVLEYFQSPRALRVARSKLIEVLRPRGWLLVGNVRAAPIVEEARWIRRLPRGGLQINAFIAEHSHLETVAKDGDDNYSEVILARRPDVS